jgi:hypothetical protein
MLVRLASRAGLKPKLKLAAAKIMDSLQPLVAALMGPKELRGWIRQAQARR